MFRTSSKITLITTALVLLLSACSFSASPTNTPQPTPDLNAIATQVAGQVMAGLTATAASWTATPTTTSTSTPGPTDANIGGTATPTQTATLTPTDSLVPTLTQIFAPGVTVTPSTDASYFNACYNSQLVSDLTVPRGEEYLPGSQFTKIWEIKNTGTCTWNSNYSMTFGYSTPVYDFYNASTTLNKTEVKPGDTVQVSIVIKLPTTYPTEGAYNIGYRLANDNGYNFGAWFFVYVTITPPTPTP